MLCNYLVFILILLMQIKIRKTEHSKDIDPD